MSEKDWRDRVVVEKSELDEKIKRLRFFIEETDRFQLLPTAQKQLLLRQVLTMKEYSVILSQRLYLGE